MSHTSPPCGPLRGLKVIEIAGIGPGPFCAMLMADLGADVLRICRVDAELRTSISAARFDLMNRGRPSVAIDLKKPEGAGLVRQLASAADALIEGFRPGVMERLGLGPEDLSRHNPKLVYGRMTGWGQQGPRAPTAGHDINYIALAGALYGIGTKDAPVPPLNLVGDFGGALYLAFGIMSAIYEAQRSGCGQVVDAAMVDGAASMMTMFAGLIAGGTWREARSENFLDGAAPFYGVYETADGEHMAVGAIEGKFYVELLEGLGLDPAEMPPQNDRQHWPETKERFAAIFRSRTRAEWCDIFADREACVAPVLRLGEAPEDPHLAARGTFTTVEGITQPAPAPRFSRTPGRIQRPPAEPGADTGIALARWGVPAETINRLAEQGIIAARALDNLEDEVETAMLFTI